MICPHCYAVITNSADKYCPNCKKPWGKMESINVTRAYEYYNAGKANNNVEQLKEAIRLKPDYMEAYFALGQVYYNKYNYSTAIDAFKEAIRLKPDYEEAYYQLGIAFYKVKNYSAAIDSFKTVIKLYPSHYGAISMLERTEAEMRLEKESEERKAAEEDRNKKLLVSKGLEHYYYMLDTDDLSIRAQAVENLFLGGIEGVRYLAKAFNSGNKNMYLCACWAFMSTKPIVEEYRERARKWDEKSYQLILAEAMPALIRELEKIEYRPGNVFYSDMFWDTVGALKYIGDRTAIPAMRSLLKKMELRYNIDGNKEAYVSIKGLDGSYVSGYWTNKMCIEHVWDAYNAIYERKSFDTKPESSSVDNHPKEIFSEKDYPDNINEEYYSGYLNL